jgi:hypothetical protein
MNLLADKVLFLNAYVPKTNYQIPVPDPIPIFGSWGLKLPGKIDVVQLNPKNNPFMAHLLYFDNNSWIRTDAVSTTNLIETTSKFWTHIQ